MILGGSGYPLKNNFIISLSYPQTPSEIESMWVRVELNEWLEW